MYYYLLSQGEYDDYFSLEFSHPEKLTEDEVIERMLEKYEDGKAEVKRLETQMWDECEQLFGTRMYPHLGLPGIKGTPEELRRWDNKWKEIFPICKELVCSARLAGFELVRPTAACHFKWGVEEFFEHGGKDIPPFDDESD